MHESIHGFGWTYFQSHLPIITLILVGVPLVLLLYKDFIRLSQRNSRKKDSEREFVVLSPKRDKDGMPFFVNLYGEPVHAKARVTSIDDFESRRVAAMRSAKSRY